MNASTLLAAAALTLCASARAQETVAVRRGTLEVKVKVTGTVVPEDVFRLKSAIDGRIEAVLASTGAWYSSSQALSFLANKELAALVDSKGTTQREILESRWQDVYHPIPVRCPGNCFLLKTYAKTKLWVKPRTILFEAAGRLLMVGRVRPEDAHWIKDGQDLVFWAVKDPGRTYKGRVTKYVLDIQGEAVEPGGTFTLEMSPDRWFPPGTEWEGTIVPLSRRNVLIVPTGALIRKGSDVFLPVRVSTGITTQTLTEVSAGVDNGRKVLVLDDSQLREAERHQQQIDYDAIERRRTEGEAPEARPDRRDPAPQVIPRRDRERSGDLPDPDSNLGEDPYSE